MDIKEFKEDQVIEFKDLVSRITGTVLRVTETHLEVGSDHGLHEVTNNDQPVLLANRIEDL